MKYGITALICLFVQLAISAQTSTFDIPTLISDTTICEAYPLQLATVENTATTTTYIWSPAEAFEDPTDPNAVISPRLANQVYTLIATSEDSTQADTQFVTVDIIPSRINILNGAVQEVCAPYDSIILTATTSPAGSAIAWSPNAGILRNNGASITVNPPISVTYVASYTANGCFQTDSVLLKVDSLPRDMSIALDPVKDPYCQGDTFFLRSPIYDAGDFTGITHEWRDAPGLQTGDSLYNGFVLAADSSMFLRITNNGACERTDSIQVNVLTPPAYTLTPGDTSICAGGEVAYVFELNEDIEGSLSWSPSEGLSCDDCFTPIARPTQSATYTATLMAEGSDCSFPITRNIGIYAPPVLDVVQRIVVCPGGNVRPFRGQPEAGVTYSITGPGLTTDDPLFAIMPTVSGIYTYTATTPCDVVVATSEIIIADEVVLEIDGPAVVCADDVATYTAIVTQEDGIGEQGRYEWFVNGVSLPNSNEESIERSLPAGEYTIRVDYTNRCGVATASRTVQVGGDAVRPTLTITADNGDVLAIGDTIFSEDQVVFTANNPNGDAYTYTWEGNGSPSNGEGASFTVTAAETNASALDDLYSTMTYRLNYTNNATGCGGGFPISLTILRVTYAIPDLISPNNDRNNDDFRLFYNGTVSDFSLLIFNRWGQLVYESNDPEAGWNGTVDGTPQPMDTYLYKVQFMQNGQAQKANGKFVLVR